MTKAAKAYPGGIQPGQRFHRLTAIAPAGYRLVSSGERKPLWRFRCDCGKETKTQSANVKGGYTRSCGCLHLETAAKLGRTRRKHGLYGTRIYSIWCSMVNRCANPQHHPYHAGRGIAVCTEWRRDVRCFHEWAIANGYEDNLTLDRIDNDGNYEPANCRWVTPWDQAQNRRQLNKVAKRYEVVLECLRKSSLIDGRASDQALRRLARDILSGLARLRRAPTPTWSGGSVVRDVSDSAR